MMQISILPDTETTLSWPKSTKTGMLFYFVLSIAPNLFTGLFCGGILWQESKINLKNKQTDKIESGSVTPSFLAALFSKPPPCYDIVSGALIGVKIPDLFYEIKNWLDPCSSLFSVSCDRIWNKM